ncbi:enterochelin esterase [Vibrio alginolyticus]
MDIKAFRIIENKNINSVLSGLLEDNEEVGAPCWWNEVQTKGTPFILSQDNTSVELLFLWRNTDDSVKEIYIDINGITDHHSFDMARLTHVKGTDVWFYKARVNSTWRGSYTFIPVTHERVQPAYHGTYQEKRTKHREWLRTIFPLSVRDDLSKNNLSACEWGRSKTPLSMPKAVSQSAWSRFDTKNGNVQAGAGMQLAWTSQCLGNERYVWLYSTASADQMAELPLVLVLDGQFWSQSMPLFSALTDATSSGQLPPALYVFIDEINLALRSEEFSCNPLFWQAITQELLPLVGHYFPITNEANRTAVVGQSLGGLSAMYAGLNHPDRFGAVVCQSGSFWWPDFSLVKPPSEYSPLQTSEPLTQMSQLVHSGLGSNVKLSVFMEVGLGEDIMVDLSQDLYQQLKQQNHRLSFRTFDGGHERLCWRGGIIDGLSYVFNFES